VTMQNIYQVKTRAGKLRREQKCVTFSRYVRRGRGGILSKHYTRN
jgi:hypothetical protein